jgi:lipoprotein-anchoring transpeptidase ErfK/SrfK
MTRGGVLCAVLAGAALAIAPLAVGATSRPGAEGVEIARVVVASSVRSLPTSDSALRGRIAAIRPLTRQQTALPVVRRAEDRHGAEWLLVRLPGRPAGRVGWLPAANAIVTHSPWWVVVDRSARRASVYRNGRLYRRYPVVVGTAWTPTPAGRYFVVEHVRQVPGSILGPWALATSAFSHVLQEFDGGPGQIALHGRAGVLAGDPLGTARSHGCIRFDNAVIQRLSGLLTNGTPIDIV